MASEPLDPEDVLDLITSLVEKSLLRVEESDDGARYRMLETIRDYAREKLIMRDEQTTLGAAHCDYFLAMAKAANRGMEGPDEARMDAASGRRARRHARSDRGLALNGGVDPIISVKFEVALMGSGFCAATSTEGRNYVRTSLALPAVRRATSRTATRCMSARRWPTARAFMPRRKHARANASTLRRKLDIRFDLAATLSTLSLVMLHAGNAPCRSAEERERSRSIFRELEHRTGEAMALLHLGQIEAYVGNLADGRGYLGQAIAIARDIGHAEVEGEASCRSGSWSSTANNIDAAAARFERSEEVCVEAEDKRGQAGAMWWLGKVDLLKAKFESARLRLCAALRAFHAFEMNAELTAVLRISASCSLSPVRRTSEPP